QAARANSTSAPPPGIGGLWVDGCCAPAVNAKAEKIEKQRKRMGRTEIMDGSFHPRQRCFWRPGRVQPAAQKSHVPPPREARSFQILNRNDHPLIAFKSALFVS